MIGARRGAVVAAVLVTAVVMPPQGAAGGVGGMGPAPGPPEVTVTRLLPPVEGPVRSWPANVGTMRLTNRGHALVLAPAGPDRLANGVWRRGTLELLPPPPEETPDSVGARDISERGQVVGAYSVTHTTCSQAPAPVWPCPVPVSWSNGELVRLPTDGRFGIADQVNTRGQITGELVGPGTPPQPVAWDAGRLVRPPGSPTIVELGDLNDRGQVAVTLDVGGTRHAGIWQIGGTLTDLGPVGGTAASAGALNDRGHLAGIRQAPDGTYRAFLWRDGEVTDLGAFGDQLGVVALNDRDQVLLQASGDAGTQGYMWDDGEVTELGVGAVLDLNDRGQVIASREQADRSYHAVVWHGGRWIDLHPLAATEGNTTAVDINDRGQILGIAPGLEIVRWTVHPRR